MVIPFMDCLEFISPYRQMAKDFARVQAGYARDRCAAGETVDYQQFDGLDHISIVAANAPTVPVLIKWTQARFAGITAPAICPK